MPSGTTALSKTPLLPLNVWIHENHHGKHPETGGPIETANQCYTLSADSRLALLTASQKASLWHESKNFSTDTKQK